MNALQLCQRQRQRRKPNIKNNKVLRERKNVNKEGGSAIQKQRRQINGLRKKKQKKNMRKECKSTGGGAASQPPLPHAREGR